MLAQCKGPSRLFRQCADTAWGDAARRRLADAACDDVACLELTTSSHQTTTIPHRSRCCCNRFVHTMGRDESLDALVEILKGLVPIAKAVPILGPTVEGSLEATIQVIEFTQVR
jgi:hypothetical protein